MIGLSATTVHGRFPAVPLPPFSTVSAKRVVPPYLASRPAITWCAVSVAFLVIAANPTVNATSCPAFLTVVGYVTPSRTVSSAVARVSTMLQPFFVGSGGHWGDTTGDFVAPSTTVPPIGGPVVAVVVVVVVLAVVVVVVFFCDLEVAPSTAAGQCPVKRASTTTTICFVHLI